MHSCSINKYLGHLPWTLWHLPLFFLTPKEWLVCITGARAHLSLSFLWVDTCSLLPLPSLPSFSCRQHCSHWRCSSGITPGTCFALSPIPGPTGTSHPTASSTGSGKPLFSHLAQREDFPQLSLCSIPASGSLYRPTESTGGPACHVAASWSHRLSPVGTWLDQRKCPPSPAQSGGPWVPTIWPGEGAGSQSGRFLEWDLQTKISPPA